MVKKHSAAPSLLQATANSKAHAHRLGNYSNSGSYSSQRRDPPISRIQIEPGCTPKSPMSCLTAEGPYSINLQNYDDDDDVVVISHKQDAPEEERREPPAPPLDAPEGEEEDNQNENVPPKEDAPQQSLLPPRLPRKVLHRYASDAAVVAASASGTADGIAKKHMDLNNGISLTAPSPLTLDRVVLQSQQSSSKTPNSNTLWKQDSQGQGFERKLTDSEPPEEDASTSSDVVPPPPTPVDRPDVDPILTEPTFSMTPSKLGAAPKTKKIAFDKVRKLLNRMKPKEVKALGKRNSGSKDSKNSSKKEAKNKAASLAKSKSKDDSHSSSKKSKESSKKSTSSRSKNGTPKLEGVAHAVSRIAYPPSDESVAKLEAFELEMKASNKSNSKDASSTGSNKQPALPSKASRDAGSTGTGSNKQAGSFKKSSTTSSILQQAASKVSCSGIITDKSTKDALAGLTSGGSITAKSTKGSVDGDTSKRSRLSAGTGTYRAANNASSKPFNRKIASKASADCIAIEATALADRLKQADHTLFSSNSDDSADRFMQTAHKALFDPNDEDDEDDFAEFMAEEKVKLTTDFVLEAAKSTNAELDEDVLSEIISQVSSQRGSLQHSIHKLIIAQSRPATSVATGSQQQKKEQANDASTMDDAPTLTTEEKNATSAFYQTLLARAMKLKKDKGAEAKLRKVSGSSASVASKSKNKASVSSSSEKKSSDRLLLARQTPVHSAPTTDDSRPIPTEIGVKQKAKADVVEDSPVPKEVVVESSKSKTELFGKGKRRTFGDSMASSPQDSSQRDSVWEKLWEKWEPFRKEGKDPPPQNEPSSSATTSEKDPVVDIKANRTDPPESLGPPADDAHESNRKNISKKESESKETGYGLSKKSGSDIVSDGIIVIDEDIVQDMSDLEGPKTMATPNQPVYNVEDNGRYTVTDLTDIGEGIDPVSNSDPDQPILMVASTLESLERMKSSASKAAGSQSRARARSHSPARSPRFGGGKPIRRTDVPSTVELPMAPIDVEDSVTMTHRLNQYNIGGGKLSVPGDFPPEVIVMDPAVRAAKPTVNKTGLVRDKLKKKAEEKAEKHKAKQDEQRAKAKGDEASVRTNFPISEVKAFHERESVSDLENSIRNFPMVKVTSGGTINTVSELDGPGPAASKSEEELDPEPDLEHEEEQEKEAADETEDSRVSDDKYAAVARRETEQENWNQPSTEEYDFMLHDDTGLLRDDTGDPEMAAALADSITEWSIQEVESDDTGAVAVEVMLSSCNQTRLGQMFLQNIPLPFKKKKKDDVQTVLKRINEQGQMVLLKKPQPQKSQSSSENEDKKPKSPSKPVQETPRMSNTGKGQFSRDPGGKKDKYARKKSKNDPLSGPTDAPSLHSIVSGMQTSEAQSSVQASEQIEVEGKDGKRIPLSALQRALDAELNGDSDDSSDGSGFLSEAENFEQFISTGVNIDEILGLDRSSESKSEPTTSISEPGSESNIIDLVDTEEGEDEEAMADGKWLLLEAKRLVLKSHINESEKKDLLDTLATFGQDRFALSPAARAQLVRGLSNISEDIIPELIDLTAFAESYGAEQWQSKITDATAAASASDEEESNFRQFATQQMPDQEFTKNPTKSQDSLETLMDLASQLLRMKGDHEGGAGAQEDNSSTTSSEERRKKEGPVVVQGVEVPAWKAKKGQVGEADQYTQQLATRGDFFLSNNGISLLLDQVMKHAGEDAFDAVCQATEKFSCGQNLPENPTLSNTQKMIEDVQREISANKGTTAAPPERSQSHYSDSSITSNDLQKTESQPVELDMTALQQGANAKRGSQPGALGALFAITGAALCGTGQNNGGFSVNQALIPQLDSSSHLGVDTTGAVAHKDTAQKPPRVPKASSRTGFQQMLASFSSFGSKSEGVEVTKSQTQELKIETNELNLSQVQSQTQSLLQTLSQPLGSVRDSEAAEGNLLAMAEDGKDQDIPKAAAEETPKTKRTTRKPPMPDDVNFQRTKRPTDGTSPRPAKKPAPTPGAKGSRQRPQPEMLLQVKRTPKATVNTDEGAMPISDAQKSTRPIEDESDEGSTKKETSHEDAEVFASIMRESLRCRSGLDPDARKLDDIHQEESGTDSESTGTQQDSVAESSNSIAGSEVSEEPTPSDEEPSNEEMEGPFVEDNDENFGEDNEEALSDNDEPSSDDEYELDQDVAANHLTAMGTLEEDSDEAADVDRYQPLDPEAGEEEQPTEGKEGTITSPASEASNSVNSVVASENSDDASDYGGFLDQDLLPHEPSGQLAEQKFGNPYSLTNSQVSRSYESQIDNSVLDSKEEAEDQVELPEPQVDNVASSRPLEEIPSKAKSTASNSGIATVSLKGETAQTDGVPYTVSSKESGALPSFGEKDSLAKSSNSSAQTSTESSGVVSLSPFLILTGSREEAREVIDLSNRESPLSGNKAGTASEHSRYVQESGASDSENSRDLIKLEALVNGMTTSEDSRELHRSELIQGDSSSYAIMSIETMDKSGLFSGDGSRQRASSGGTGGDGAIEAVEVPSDMAGKEERAGPSNIFSSSASVSLQHDPYSYDFRKNSILESRDTYDFRKNSILESKDTDPESLRNKNSMLTTRSEAMGSTALNIPSDVEEDGEDNIVSFPAQQSEFSGQSRENDSHDLAAMSDADFNQRNEIIFFEEEETTESEYNEGFDEEHLPINANQSVVSCPERQASMDGASLEAIEHTSAPTEVFGDHASIDQSTLESTSETIRPAPSSGDQKVTDSGSVRGGAGAFEGVHQGGKKLRQAMTVKTSSMTYQGSIVSKEVSKKSTYHVSRDLPKASAQKITGPMDPPIDPPFLPPAEQVQAVDQPPSVQESTSADSNTQAHESTSKSTNENAFLVPSLQSVFQRSWRTLQPPVPNVSTADMNTHDNENANQTGSWKLEEESIALSPRSIAQKSVKTLHPPLPNQSMLESIYDDRIANNETGSWQLEQESLASLKTPVISPSQSVAFHKPTVSDLNKSPAIRVQEIFGSWKQSQDIACESKDTKQPPVPAKSVDSPTKNQESSIQIQIESVAESKSMASDSVNRSVRELQSVQPAIIQKETTGAQMPGPPPAQVAKLSGHPTHAESGPKNVQSASNLMRTKLEGKVDGRVEARDEEGKVKIFTLTEWQNIENEGTEVYLTGGAVIKSESETESESVSENDAGDGDAIMSLSKSDYSKIATAASTSERVDQILALASPGEPEGAGPQKKGNYPSACSMGAMLCLAPLAPLVVPLGALHAMKAIEQEKNSKKQSEDDQQQDKSKSDHHASSEVKTEAVSAEQPQDSKASAVPPSLAAQHASNSQLAVPEVKKKTFCSNAVTACIGINTKALKPAKSISCVGGDMKALEGSQRRHPNEIMSTEHIDFFQELPIPPKEDDTKSKLTEAQIDPNTLTREQELELLEEMRRKTVMSVVSDSSVSQCSSFNSLKSSLAGGKIQDDLDSLRSYSMKSSFDGKDGGDLRLRVQELYSAEVGNRDLALAVSSQDSGVMDTGKHKSPGTPKKSNGYVAGVNSTRLLAAKDTKTNIGTVDTYHVKIKESVHESLQPNKNPVAALAASSKHESLPPSENESSIADDTAASESQSELAQSRMTPRSTSQPMQQLLRLPVPVPTIASANIKLSVPQAIDVQHQQEQVSTSYDNTPKHRENLAPTIPTVGDSGNQASDSQSYLSGDYDTESCNSTLPTQRDDPFISKNSTIESTLLTRRDDPFISKNSTIESRRHDSTDEAFWAHPPKPEMGLVSKLRGNTTESSYHLRDASGELAADDISVGLQMETASHDIVDSLRSGVEDLVETSVSSSSKSKISLPKVDSLPIRDAKSTRAESVVLEGGSKGSTTHSPALQSDDSQSQVLSVTRSEQEEVLSEDAYNGGSEIDNTSYSSSGASKQSAGSNDRVVEVVHVSQSESSNEKNNDGLAINRGLGAKGSFGEGAVAYSQPLESQSMSFGEGEYNSAQLTRELADSNATNSEECLSTIPEIEANSQSSREAKMGLEESCESSGIQGNSAMPDPPRMSTKELIRLYTDSQSVDSKSAEPSSQRMESVTASAVESTAASARSLEKDIQYTAQHSSDSDAHLSEAISGSKSALSSGFNDAFVKEISSGSGGQDIALQSDASSSSREAIQTISTMPFVRSDYEAASTTGVSVAHLLSKSSDSSNFLSSRTAYSVPELFMRAQAHDGMPPRYQHRSPKHINTESREGSHNITSYRSSSSNYPQTFTDNTNNPNVAPSNTAGTQSYSSMELSQGTANSIAGEEIASASLASNSLPVEMGHSQSISRKGSIGENQIGSREGALLERHAISFEDRGGPGADSAELLHRLHQTQNLTNHSQSNISYGHGYSHSSSAHSSVAKPHATQYFPELPTQIERNNYAAYPKGTNSYDQESQIPPNFKGRARAASTTGVSLGSDQGTVLQLDTRSVHSAPANARSASDKEQAWQKGVSSPSTSMERPIDTTLLNAAAERRILQSTKVGSGALPIQATSQNNDKEVPDNNASRSNESGKDNSLHGKPTTASVAADSSSHVDSTTSELLRVAQKYGSMGDESMGNRLEAMLDSLSDMKSEASGVSSDNHNVSVAEESTKTKTSYASRITTGSAAEKAAGQVEGGPDPQMFLDEASTTAKISGNSSGSGNRENSGEAPDTIGSKMGDVDKRDLIESALASRDTKKKPVDYKQLLESISSSSGEMDSPRKTGKSVSNPIEVLRSTSTRSINSASVISRSASAGPSKSSSSTGASHSQPSEPTPGLATLGNFTVQVSTGNRREATSTQTTFVYNDIPQSEMEPIVIKSSETSSWLAISDSETSNRIKPVPQASFGDNANSGKGELEAIPQSSFGEYENAARAIRMNESGSWLKTSQTGSASASNNPRAIKTVETSSWILMSDSDPGSKAEATRAVQEAPQDRMSQQSLPGGDQDDEVSQAVSSSDGTESSSYTNTAEEVNDSALRNLASSKAVESTATRDFVNQIINDEKIQQFASVKGGSSNESSDDDAQMQEALSLCYSPNDDDEDDNEHFGTPRGQVNHIGDDLVLSSSASSQDTASNQAHIEVQRVAAGSLGTENQRTASSRDFVDMMLPDDGLEDESMRSEKQSESSSRDFVDMMLPDDRDENGPKTDARRATSGRDFVEMTLPEDGVEDDSVKSGNHRSNFGEGVVHIVEDDSVRTGMQSTDSGREFVHNLNQPSNSWHRRAMAGLSKTVNPAAGLTDNGDSVKMAVESLGRNSAYGNNKMDFASPGKLREQDLSIPELSKHYEAAAGSGNDNSNHNRTTRTIDDAYKAEASVANSTAAVASRPSFESSQAERTMQVHRPASNRRWMPQLPEQMDVSDANSSEESATATSDVLISDSGTSTSDETAAISELIAHFDDVTLTNENGRLQVAVLSDAASIQNNSEFLKALQDIRRQRTITSPEPDNQSESYQSPTLPDLRRGPSVSWMSPQGRDSNIETHADFDYNDTSQPQLPMLRRYHSMSSGVLSPDEARGSEVITDAEYEYNASMQPKLPMLRHNSMVSAMTRSSAEGVDMTGPEYNDDSSQPRLPMRYNPMNVGIQSLGFRGTPSIRRYDSMQSGIRSIDTNISAGVTDTRDDNDQHDTASIQRSDSSGMSSVATHASQKARELRAQLDQALKTSAAIRSTQERLGAELSTFKKRLDIQRQTSNNLSPRSSAVGTASPRSSGLSPASSANNMRSSLSSMQQPVSPSSSTLNSSFRRRPRSMSQLNEHTTSEYTTTSEASNSRGRHAAAMRLRGYSESPARGRRLMTDATARRVAEATKRRSSYGNPRSMSAGRAGSYIQERRGSTTTYYSASQEEQAIEVVSSREGATREYSSSGKSSTSTTEASADIVFNSIQRQETPEWRRRERQRQLQSFARASYNRIEEDAIVDLTHANTEEDERKVSRIGRLFF